MADSDKTLKLLIEIMTQEVGERRAAEILSEAQAGNAKLSASQEDLGRSTEQATEKFRLFHSEGREMHKVITELTRISPALGEAMRIAMHPIGGTIAAAIGLFVLMKEHIKEVNAELDAMAESAAQPQFLDGIKAKQEVLRAAAEAAEAYAAKLNSVTEGEHSITGELTAQLALQTAINNAKSAQVNAESALALAKINADVSAGKITPEEGEMRSAEAKRKAILDSANAAQSAQQQELATKQKAAADLSLQLPGGRTQAQGMADSARDEATRRAGTAADFGDDAYAAKKKSATAAVAAAQKKYDEAGGKEIADDEEELKTNTNEWQRENLREMIKRRRNETQSQADDLQKAQAAEQTLDSGHRQYLADQKSQPEFNARQQAAKDAKDIAAAQDKLAKEIAALTAAIKGTQTANEATTRAKLGEVTAEEIGNLLKIIPKNQDAGRNLGLHPDDVHRSAAISQLDAGRAEIQAISNGYAKAVADHNKELAAALADAFAQIRASNAALIQQIKNSGDRGFSQ